jgi:hypothetical protein
VVFLGDGFATRNSLKDPSHHSLPYLSLSIIILLHFLISGILGFIDPKRGCPSFYGKKRLKAQRG